MWMSHSLIFFTSFLLWKIESSCYQLFLNAWEQCQPCILAKRLDLMVPHHTRFLSALSRFLFRSLSPTTVSFYFLSLPKLPSPPSVSPSFSLTPFLWLAVSLGLCTFQAGKSEALSKHQPPRSAQRNPSWLSPRCRPPCLPFLHFSSAASLTYELVECPLYFLFNFYFILHH